MVNKFKKLCLIFRNNIISHFFLGRKRNIVRKIDVVLAFEAALKDAVIRSNKSFESPLCLANLAVRVNELACGPTAQFVVQFLREHNHSGFKMINIGGHYVVLDDKSKLIYDIETYDGVPINKRELLAISERTISGCNLNHAKWSERWLKQRIEAHKRLNLN